MIILVQQGSFVSFRFAVLFGVTWRIETPVAPKLLGVLTGFTVHILFAIIGLYILLIYSVSFFYHGYVFASSGKHLRVRFQEAYLAPSRIIVQDVFFSTVLADFFGNELRVIVS